MKLRKRLIFGLALCGMVLSVTSCKKNGDVIIVKPGTEENNNSGGGNQAPQPSPGENTNPSDSYEGKNDSVNKGIKVMPLIYADSEYEANKTVEEGLINVSEFADLNAILISLYSSGQLTGYGSGCIYNYDSESKYYYALTNTHVVEGMDSVKIKTSLEREVDAEIVGYSSNQDCGVVRFKSDEKYNIVKMAKESGIKKGQYCIAVGTIMQGTYFNNVTVGNVSLLNEYSIKHTASINSGNSGGPLYNLNGELLGLNNTKISGTSSTGATYDDIYFAVNIKAIEEAIADIDRPVLGVSSTEVSVILDCSNYSTYTDYAYTHYVKNEKYVSEASYNKVKGYYKYLPDGIKGGCFIVNVVEGTPAYGNLELNDIIVKVDDTEIITATDIKSVLSKKLKGDKLTLSVYRNKELITISVTL